MVKTNPFAGKPYLRRHSSAASGTLSNRRKPGRRQCFLRRQERGETAVVARGNSLTRPSIQW